MPYIYNHDLKDFASSKRLADEDTTKSTYYYNKTQEYTGDGIFSSIGSLVKPGIDLIKGNKDLIIEGAKGAAALGTVANSIHKIVDAVKEDKQLKELELVRKLQNEAKERKISNSAKKENSRDV